MEVRATKQFQAWLRNLSDQSAKRRIAQRIARVELDGFFGVTRSVGGAIREMKLDFGPGYRVYYSQRGELVTFLLTGGSKQTQEKDIAKAHEILRRLGSDGENAAFDGEV